MLFELLCTSQVYWLYAIFQNVPMCRDVGTQPLPGV